MRYGATGNYPWLGASDVAHVVEEVHDRHGRQVGRSYCGRDVYDIRDRKPGWARVCAACERRIPPEVCDE